MLRRLGGALLAACAGAGAGRRSRVGHLDRLLGRDVGRRQVPFGPGRRRRHRLDQQERRRRRQALDVETVDYGYQVPRAIAQYKKWSSADKVRSPFWAGAPPTPRRWSASSPRTRCPYFSASYLAAPDRPDRRSETARRKIKPAPYNFFYGPSYSDALRAMLTWAAEDWKTKGKPGQAEIRPHGRQPSLSATRRRRPARRIAKELGFEVLPPIQFALTPGDYKAQCLTLKASGANYAFLGNTAGSNISVLNACETVGVDVQFLGNVWGMDETGMKAAGEARGRRRLGARAAAWGRTRPGMKTVPEISKHVRPDRQRPIGRCTTSPASASVLLHERSDRMGCQERQAQRREHQEGALQTKDWVPAGIEGVCIPRPGPTTDHRARPRTSIAIASR